MIHPHTRLSVRTATGGLEGRWKRAVKFEYEHYSLCMVYKLFIEFRWDLTDQTDSQFDDFLSL